MRLCAWHSLHDETYHWHRCRKRRGAGPNFCPHPHPHPSTTEDIVNKQTAHFLSYQIVENGNSCNWDFGTDINEFSSLKLLKSRSSWGLRPQIHHRRCPWIPPASVAPGPRLFRGQPTLPPHPSHFKLPSYAYHRYFMLIYVFRHLCVDHSRTIFCFH